MRIYWLRDRVKQGQFEITWESGKSNKADYPSKHHTGAHHRQGRPVYLHIDGASTRTVQGCIKFLNPSHKQKGTKAQKRPNPNKLKAYCGTWKEREALLGDKNTALNKAPYALINCQ
eukprot:jgi/Psemu1/11394/gm1.11394_g